jgi:hypothetical protein
MYCVCDSSAVVMVLILVVVTFFYVRQTIEAVDLKTEFAA